MLPFYVHGPVPGRDPRRRKTDEIPFILKPYWYLVSVPVMPAVAVATDVAAAAPVRRLAADKEVAGRACDDPEMA